MKRNFSVNPLVFLLSCLLLLIIITLDLLGWSIAQSKESELSLPDLQAHPLPLTLKNWNDSQNQGDYYSFIEPSPVGSLVWSQFPIQIYWERPLSISENSASTRRFEQWTEAVEEAIAEWSQYLPIVEVKEAEIADILIKRENPALGATINAETGKLEIPRARSAQTRYEFYIKQDGSPILSHRMTIEISPNLSQESILSATRHELGHALGIWGHSPVETDALYFSQVRHPPSISVRDINTLKKVYEQPTRLGWQLRKEL